MTGGPVEVVLSDVSAIAMTSDGSSLFWTTRDGVMTYDL
ncbi:hypothetical protein BH09MYX1_BH09MYX1_27700 [soil metagenome]